MKKKILVRSLLGAPLGLALSFLITVAISWALGDGTYHSVVPELIPEWGNELNAVTAQTVLSLIMGAFWGGTSVIWDIDHWSLLRKSVTHLLLCLIVPLPIAYILCWMPRSLSGILSYCAIFFGIYLFVWLSQYLAIRSRLKKINAKLEKSSTIS